MFSVEFSSDRPIGAAPYYTLVVRDPYIVGSFQSCDVPLHGAGIPDQHVALVVMRESQANRIADGIEEGEAEAAHIDFVRSHVTQLMTDPVTRDASGSYTLQEEDPLVVFLTVLPPQDEQDEEAAARTAACVVRVGDIEVPVGSGTIIYDKSEVHIGPEVSLVFHYRPLVVSVQRDDFSEDEIADFLYVCLQLGATVCPVLGGPAPDLTALPKPIGLLHAADALRNTADCLVALAAGYSVVKTSYIPEWFAVVAQSAASPLSVLPPPSQFAVPLQRDSTTGSYVRPETDNCPFSLYPIPSTALRNRLRRVLFAGKSFLFYTPEAAAQYEPAICAAGGSCYTHPDQTAEAREAIAAASIAAADGVIAHGPALYIVLGTDLELAVSQHTDEIASELGDTLRFLRGSDANVAQHVTIDILPGSAIFDALLTNAFAEDRPGAASANASPSKPTMNEPIEASVAPASAVADRESTVATTVRDEPSVRAHEPIQDRDMDSQVAYRQAPYGGAHSEEPVSVADEEEEPVAAAAEPQVDADVAPAAACSSHPPATQLQVDDLIEQRAEQDEPVHQEDANNNNNKSESHSARDQRRRSSLLPRDSNRTPSRSQMRSLVRARASSVNSGGASGDEAGGAPAPMSERRGSMASSTTAGTRGRRHLVSLPNDKPETFNERFDSLRLRIYAFLTKEDPELDRQMATMQRNRFVDDSVMEHTLEVKAQAVDYMEMVDDLLIESTGPYTEALRRYWSDCCDLDNKAQRLLTGHRRQSNAAGYRRPSFLNEDAEAVPKTGAPVPHARSPRQSPASGTGRRRSSDSRSTPRATTPRGSRREAYHSIAHNQVEDETIDYPQPITQAALLPPTPRTAAMQQQQQQQQQRAQAMAAPHSAASAPLTVTTRRRASPTANGSPRDAQAASHADPSDPYAPHANAERPVVPPVDIASVDGSQRNAAAAHQPRRSGAASGARKGSSSSNGRRSQQRKPTREADQDQERALTHQYRPSTPRQRTIGLDAPMSVRARSSSARRGAPDRPAPEPQSSVQRAPPPMTAERNGAAKTGARKRSKTPASRSGTPRGQYAAQRSASAQKRPAWQY